MIRNASAPTAINGPISVPECPPHCQSKTEQQDSIQHEHGDPRPSLRYVRIVFSEYNSFSEMPLIPFFKQGPEGWSLENIWGKKRTHPQLDQRRMFRIQTVIAQARVSNARSDVIGLVDIKTVEAGSDGGAENSAKHQSQQQCEDSYVSARAPHVRGSIDGFDSPSQPYVRLDFKTVP